MRLRGWSSYVCSSDLAVEPEFVDRTGARIDRLADRFGRGNRIKRRRRAEAHARGVDPDSRDLLLLAQQDRLGGAFDDDDHFGGLVLRVGNAPAGIEDSTEQQQFGAGEAVGDLDIALRHIGHPRRLLGANEKPRETNKPPGRSEEKTTEPQSL